MLLTPLAVIAGSIALIGFVIAYTCWLLLPIAQEALQLMALRQRSLGLTAQIDRGQIHPGSAEYWRAIEAMTNETFLP